MGILNWSTLSADFSIEKIRVSPDSYAYLTFFLNILVMGSIMVTSIPEPESHIDSELVFKEINTFGFI